jgi:hypothetical protein
LFKCVSESVIFQPEGAHHAKRGFFERKQAPFNEIQPKSVTRRAAQASRVTLMFFLAPNLEKLTDFLRFIYSFLTIDFYIYSREVRNLNFHSKGGSCYVSTFSETQYMAGDGSTPARDEPPL